MRPLIAAALIGFALTLPVARTGYGQVGGASTYSSSSRSVGVPGLPLSRSYTRSFSSETISPFYAPPGNFGVAYGSLSYGVPRTYSVYSSSYGGGYAYGYGPSAVASGRYGVGLWRPGLAAPGYIYGSSSYWTFPVPYRPVEGLPPVGAYAPGFGPAPGLALP